jgi:hypothetical protein
MCSGNKLWPELRYFWFAIATFATGLATPLEAVERQAKPNTVILADDTD